jgi:acyl-[acyl carrier protein]--UDP-N-acetylglucosamine O-acyltransferase
MRNPRAKKTFAEMAKNMKELRRRPLSEEQINDLNQTFREIEQQKKSEDGKTVPKKKIARAPEAEI